MWELEKKKHEATSRPGGRQRLSVSNSWSGRHWELDQGPAVGDRTDIVQLGTGHPCGRRRRSTACGPSTTRGCVPRGRRPDARRHATVPQAWMQREYWEFETHTLPHHAPQCTREGRDRDRDPRKRNAFVRPAVPASTPDRYVRRGLASRYGDAFDGKPTASGEPFDSNGGLTRLNRLIYQNL